MTALRVKNRGENLKFFRQNEGISPPKSSSMVIDEHLLWLNYTGPDDLDFFSPLGSDYLAFFDSYIELANKSSGFVRAEEVENFLRDRNDRPAFAKEFNFELAKTLAEKLGARLQLRKNQQGFMVCHCHGHLMGGLLKLIKEKNFSTPGELQNFIPFGDKCGSCLAPSSQKNRPCDSSILFSLAKSAPLQFDRGFWRQTLGATPAKENHFFAANASWLEKVRPVHNYCHNVFTSFYPTNLGKFELLNFQGTSIDYVLKTDSELDLSLIKAISKLVEGSFRYFSASSLKLRVFQLKEGVPTLLEL